MRTNPAPLPMLAAHLPELDRALASGLDALSPAEHLPSLQRAYPASRFAALEPQSLTGLTLVDLILAIGEVAGPSEVRHLLRTIHLTLRPGGLFVWVDAGADGTLLDEAGFVETRRVGALWTALRSAR